MTRIGSKTFGRISSDKLGSKCQNLRSRSKQLGSSDGRQHETSRLGIDLEYKTCLGYVPISISAPRPLGAAYVPIFLGGVELEQRPSGKRDRHGEVELAYTVYDPFYGYMNHFIFDNFRKFLQIRHNYVDLSFFDLVICPFVEHMPHCRFIEPLRKGTRDNLPN